MPTPMLGRAGRSLVVGVDDSRLGSSTGLGGIAASAVPSAGLDALFDDLHLGP